MNVQETKRYILQNAVQVLEPDNATKKHNYDLNSKQAGFVCPKCGSGSHSDNGTGMKLNPNDADGTHFKCMACGFYGDVIDILAEQDGVQNDNFMSKLKNACKHYNIDFKRDVTGYHIKQKKGERGYALDWDGDPIYEPDDDAPTAEQNPEIMDELAAVNTKLQASGQDNGTGTNTRAHTLKGSKKPAQAAAGEPDYFNEILEWNSHIDECDYLDRRGISKAIQKKFLIGYCAAWKHPGIEPSKVQYVPATPRIIIPTSNGSYLARDIRTDVPEKQKPFIKQKAGPTCLLNTIGLATPEPCFIVEGEIDALSIIELGFNAVALGSANNIDLLVKTIEQIEPDSRAPVLVLALDNDAAGAKATRQLCENLAKIGVRYHVPKSSAIYADCKDANDALLKDRDGFYARLFEQTRDPADLYEDNSAGHELKLFLDDLVNHRNQAPIPTGFKNLDTTLDGGLFAGLYVIGAISSLGKTSFTLQIADNIAKSGTDVLIFALEMSKRELIAKSISRLTFQRLKTGEDVNTLARSTRDLISNVNKNNAAQMRNIAGAAQDYAEFADNIFIIEGLGDVTIERIKTTVANHIIYRKKTPVVIIDYLQIIAPFDERCTDKQNTDKAVLELKRLSRDYNMPVFAISSFNRDNYKETVNQAAFKESGAIEYSADVLLGLQFRGAGTKEFNIDEARGGAIKDIELKILKNRNGSTPKEPIGITFYSMFNMFDEVL